MADALLLRVGARAFHAGPPPLLTPPPASCCRLCQSCYTRTIDRKPCCPPTGHIFLPVMQGAEGGKSVCVPPGLAEYGSDSDEDTDATSERGSGASAALVADASAAVAMGNGKAVGGQLSMLQTKAAASERVALQPVEAGGQDFVIGTQASNSEQPATAQAPATLLPTQPSNGWQFFQASSIRRRTTSTHGEV